MFIDEVAQRFASQIAAQVIAEKIGDIIRAAGALASNMGRNNHIGHPPQLAIGRKGFMLGDIKPSTAKLPAVQRVNQISFDDNWSAGDIDQYRTMLELLQHFLADHSLRGLIERDAENDHVGLRHQMSETFRGPEFGYTVGLVLRVPIRRQNTDAKYAQQFR